MGKPLPAGSAPDSYNESPTWLGKSSKSRNSVVEQSLGTLAVRDRYYKYILPSNGPLRNPDTKTELGNNTDPQLYNLKEDLGEQKNLANQYPAKVRVLSEKLKDYQEWKLVRPNIEDPKVKIEYKLTKLKHNE